jgi:predicted dehydrogenase
VEILSDTPAKGSRMNRGNFSRRGFLQSSLTALAATGLPTWYAREVVAAAKESARDDKKVSADTLIMGAIGIGSPQSRGRQIYNDAKGANKSARYVAACDVDARHLEKAKSDMAARGDTEVQGFKDYRELLDRKDIQAVTIATPDHWHALVAIDALKKGKDVYCEKPLTLTIEEALAVVKVARQTERVFQTGSQQRSDNRFRLACELVRNGRVGKVHRVEARIGGNPISPELPKVPVPEGFDYNLWLGPTPEADYVDNGKPSGRGQQTRCHYEFRWWYAYSGGKMTDWGAHHIDIAQWGLGKDGSGPIAIEVVSSTKPSGQPNSYDTHPKFHLAYTYEGGAQLHVSDTTLPDTVGDKDTNGVLFVGDDNKWIFVNRNKITASDPKLLSEPLPSSATKLEVSPNHMGNFMSCLKSRKRPICDVEIGAGSVIVCHLGTIALRLDKKLKWDPAKHRFDDDAANAMLSRPMRSPWKLEV